MSHLCVFKQYLRFKNGWKLLEVGRGQRSSTPRYCLPPRKICLHAHQQHLTTNWSSFSPRGMLVLSPTIRQCETFCICIPLQGDRYILLPELYTLCISLVSSKFPRIFFQISAFLIDLVVNSAFFSQVSSKFPRIFFQIFPTFPNSLFY